MTGKTDILFIHNNFPAQYRLLAGRLAKFENLRVFAIGSHTATEMRGVRLQRYQLSLPRSENTHPFATRFDLECRRAEQIIYAANVLKLAGMAPKMIFVHPGWGEALPLRQLFPNAKICVYCEFYYRPHGADVGFEDQAFGVDGLTRIHVRNAATLLALIDADIGIAPTRWQQSVFPKEFQSKIRVLHDGIDTTGLEPALSSYTHACLARPLKTGDEVLTFVARNLEPYRGFHVFMRALPAILASRPNAEVCIVGGTAVSYGSPPANGDSWKSEMLKEVGPHLDMQRVHFLGRIPHEELVALLRTSKVHVYLTYPFVVSWSLLEALALERIVVASDTAPVREVIKNGHNGFTVPFSDPSALSAKVVEVLSAVNQHSSLQRRAGTTARKHYSFEDKIFPQFAQLISELLPDVGFEAAKDISGGTAPAKRYA